MSNSPSVSRLFLTDGEIEVLEGRVIKSPVPELYGSIYEYPIFDYQLHMADTVAELEFVYLFKPTYTNECRKSGRKYKLFYTMINDKEKVIGVSIDGKVYDYHTANHIMYLDIPTTYVPDISITNILLCKGLLMNAYTFIRNRFTYMEKTKYFYHNRKIYRIDKGTTIIDSSSLSVCSLVKELFNIPVLHNNSILYIDRKYMVNLAQLIYQDAIYEIKKNDVIKCNTNPLTIFFKVRKSIKGVNISKLLSILNIDIDISDYLLEYVFDKLNLEFIYCTKHHSKDFKEGFTFGKWKDYFYSPYNIDKIIFSYGYSKPVPMRLWSYSYSCIYIIHNERVKESTPFTVNEKYVTSTMYKNDYNKLHHINFYTRIPLSYGNIKFIF